MKILIVEEEGELSMSIVSYLKNENYLCEVATDFRTTLEKIDLFNTIVSCWISLFLMVTVCRF